MECKLEFHGPECTAKVCSSSDPCLAVIGEMQCDGFNNFSQDHPIAAGVIADYKRVIHQLGG